MAVKVETRSLPGSQVEITVQADAAEVEKAFDRAYDYLAKQATVPGFRPGKAPRSILVRRFDSETIRQIAWQQFLEKSYAPALEELELRPLGEPELPELDRHEQFQSGAPVDVTSTLTVYPQPELDQYRGIKLVRPSAEVEPEDVDRQLEQLRRSFATFQPAEREQVQAGDRVQVSIQACNEHGDPLETWDTELDAEAGGERGLEGRLVGAKVGEQITYQLDEADAGSYPQLTALLKVEVRGLEEPLLPEWDEEFVRRVDEELDSVEALRENVAKQTREHYQRQADSEVRTVAAMVLDRICQVDLPRELVDHIITDQVRDRVVQLVQAGVDVDEARQQVQDSDEVFQAAGQSLASLRMHYLAEAIAAAEGLEVGEEQIEQELRQYAEVHGLEVEALRNMVELQPEARREFEERARMAQVLDLVVEAAEVEEVPREGYPVRVRRLLEEAAQQAKQEAAPAGEEQTTAESPAELAVELPAAEPEPAEGAVEPAPAGEPDAEGEGLPETVED